MEYVFIWLFLAMLFAGLGYMIGNTKGRGTEGLALGLLLGPIGFIIALLLPEQGPKCPECQGVIPYGVKRCKHCGYQFGTQERYESKRRNPNLGYWVDNNGKTEGPFTKDQLKILVRDGRLPAETNCTREGDPDWYPVSLVVE